MAEASARPGTCRSNVGCEAMDEPCTNRIRPAGPEASPLCLFQRNKRTSAPFCVQCSSPRTVVAVERGLFILELLAGSSCVSANLDLIGRAPADSGFIPLALMSRAHLSISDCT